MLRRHSLHLTLLAFSATALWAVAQQPGPEGHDANRLRLQAIRKNQEQYQKLRDNLNSFSNSKKKDAIVKLDGDLHGLSPTKQARYWNVLERYADWLDQLKKSDPATYKAIHEAPSAEQRLALIKDARDADWIKTQPKAIQEQYANLKGEARGAFVSARRQEERDRALRWLISSRFWKELETKTPLPVRLADFSYKPKGKIKDAPDINQVKEYVEHYLLPVLTDTEKKRFAEVEEKWPEYPITLVALASKHPTALPPPSPPRSVAELPKPVRERMDKKIAATKAEKKAYKELKSFEGPNFASKFAEFALRSNLQLGNEYLVSNFTALTLPMKNFINDELMPAMKDRDADQRKLTDSMGKWPEYPKTIQELASKYGLRPPWHILPDDDKFHWDRYRPRKRSADHEKVKDKEES